MRRGQYFDKDVEIPMRISGKIIAKELVVKYIHGRLYTYSANIGFEVG
jgi:hypothetical protein